MKRFKIFLIATIIFLLVTELFLRSYYGFCDSVLMEENKFYEYIAQPNQNRFRFRNLIRFNSLSMRSEEPDSTALKILGFGDSVLYGSVMVDQDSLATTLLTQSLSQQFNKNIQVLNVSAGSWGPDNAYAYLQQHGNFNARAIFLVTSSHDAYDVMNFRKTIDVYPGYESKQYSLALWEVIDRYLLPRITPKKKETKTVEPHFNTGYANFKAYCQNRNIPFFVVMIPERRENVNRSFTKVGNQILTYCATENIPVFHSFNLFENEDYRDNSHLTESGQRKLAQLIKEAMLQIVDLSKDSIVF